MSESAKSAVGGEPPAKPEGATPKVEGAPAAKTEPTPGAPGTGTAPVVAGTPAAAAAPVVPLASTAAAGAGAGGTAADEAKPEATAPASGAAPPTNPTGSAAPATPATAAPAAPAAPVAPPRTAASTGGTPAAGGAAGAEAGGASAGVVVPIDVVEGEGPTVDERLWSTTLWLSTALIMFLPPIPVFLAPLIVKRLRKRPSEFVSWHAGNSLRFATVATVFQMVYWVSATLTALSLHRLWMLAFVPALTLYTSFAVGLAAWLTLVGHNAWKGRRHRPSELRNLVFYK